MLNSHRTCFSQYQASSAVLGCGHSHQLAGVWALCVMHVQHRWLGLAFRTCTYTWKLTAHVWENEGKKEGKKDEKKTTSRTLYIKHTQQMTYLMYMYLLCNKCMIIHMQACVHVPSVSVSVRCNSCLHHARVVGVPLTDLSCSHDSTVLAFSELWSATVEGSTSNWEEAGGGRHVHVHYILL